MGSRANGRTGTTRFGRTAVTLELVYSARQSVESKGGQPPVRRVVPGDTAAVRTTPEGSAATVSFRWSAPGFLVWSLHRITGRRLLPPNRSRRGQSAGEQDVNDPVLRSRRSPDLRVVGSFTPCESCPRAARVWSRSSRKTKHRSSPRSANSPRTRNDHHARQFHARPRRRTRLSAALRPRVSARLAPVPRAREGLTAPRPCVVSGRCVMAGF
jgi:hypothetical protein